MNDFVGMEELLQDFLMEAGDMLSDVDSKLMGLEKNPADTALLNEVFRGSSLIARIMRETDYVDVLVVADPSQAGADHDSGQT